MDGLRATIDFMERFQRRAEDRALVIENERAVRRIQVALCRSVSGLELMSHILDFLPDPYGTVEPWLDELARELWGVDFGLARHAWYENIRKGGK